LSGMKRGGGGKFSRVGERIREGMGLVGSV
jgi:hypothetical protein